MKKDPKILAGDRASFNAVETVLPQGALRPELKGPELLPDVMHELEPLEADPNTLVLSHEGAKKAVLGIAQNHLELSLERPSKSGWKKVRGQLVQIDKAAESLHKALRTTCGLTALALLRTGSQLNTSDFLHRLERLKGEVARALELVPESNLGDAITSLSRLGSPNEMLLLGCQNILFACGHKNVGATIEGPLHRFSILVKCLALGRDCHTGGLSAGAMRSEKLKGRSTSKNLRKEALFLILGDVERRRGPNSDLYRRALGELTKLGG